MEFILSGLLTLLICLHFALTAHADNQRTQERAEWSLEREKLLHAAMTARPVEIRQEPREAVPHVIPEDEGELAMVGTVIWGEADE